jgi:hypothetical protein
MYMINSLFFIIDVLAFTSIVISLMLCRIFYTENKYIPQLHVAQLFVIVFMERYTINSIILSLIIIATCVSLYTDYITPYIKMLMMMHNAVGISNIVNFLNMNRQQDMKQTYRCDDDMCVMPDDIDFDDDIRQTDNILFHLTNELMSEQNVFDDNKDF